VHPFRIAGATLFQPLMRIDTSHILFVINLFIEYYMIKKADFCKNNFAPFAHPTRRDASLRDADNHRSVAFSTERFIPTE
jgi:hypothetical protein